MGVVWFGFWGLRNVGFLAWVWWLDGGGWLSGFVLFRGRESEWDGDEDQDGERRDFGERFWGKKRRKSLIRPIHELGRVWFVLNQDSTRPLQVSKI